MTTHRSVTPPSARRYEPGAFFVLVVLVLWLLDSGLMDWLLLPLASLWLD